MDKTQTDLNWSGPAISVIGLGDGLSTGLSAASIGKLEQAEFIVGSSHQVEKAKRASAGLTTLTAEIIDYPSPFSGLEQWLVDHRGRKIVLLASGDPLFFGIGGWLSKRLPAHAIEYSPNVSSVQAAFSRIGLPWQHAVTVSLHGRPLESLRCYLKQGALLACLTDVNSSPCAIAKELSTSGYDQSTLWVCEDLGGESEAITQYQVRDLIQGNDPLSVHPLHVTLIACRGGVNRLPDFPGIPDKLFATGKTSGQGLITKREVRLAVLSWLAPANGEVFWDIGAGCGSVAIEWCRWAPLGQAFAIECHPERIEFLEQNRNSFGVVHNLQVLADRAPECLGNLPDPDSVFIGGSGGSLTAILQDSWARLNPGGKIVIAVVTETSKSELLQAVNRLSAKTEDSGRPRIETIQLSIAKGDDLAGHLILRPQLPVLVMKLEKT
ncbi:precorrin-6Y C5,15-methyltransferase (decarboxylating) [Oleiphilus messinensis]|uniref:Precorrin-6Y C5,15-methyltransferase (Decarboxylating) n=1 Tax=Oleiphilus messinensis TaxID=141451 RepID=A0A1Y0IAM4_9GAMM|nr:precorrin-6y C5,15-methyltransferase (decarboxylating) subunit CbiE [Oleiphilus messinensis]ARU56806.1 precorrin-6Y C5,15-methyltransferase (decarboxylating) [Oleiphilus messinensis]